MGARALAALAALAPLAALAADPGYPGVFNPEELIAGILADFRDASLAATARIQAVSTSLFWILLSISIALSGIRSIFQQGSDLGLFFATLVRIALTAGFYLFLLQNAPDWSADLINSLSRLGSGGAGGGPAEFFDQVLNISNRFLRRLQEDDSSYLMRAVMGAGIVIFDLLMLLAAGNYLVIFIGASVVCMVGSLCLAFGVLSHTQDIAVSYLRTVLSFGLQLLCMFLLCGISLSIMERAYSDLLGATTAPIYTDLAEFVFIALLLALLSFRLPAMVGQIALGGSRPGALADLGGGMLRSGFSRLASVARSIRIHR
ncbi:MAG: P-type conjugative transfer protein TrbL [Succinivibrionaceae bacterium]|nr:P-type conjugative transfer protein TrbL [Succinivibrionaceae bacterium]